MKQTDFLTFRDFLMTVKLKSHDFLVIIRALQVGQVYRRCLVPAVMFTADFQTNVFI